VVSQLSPIWASFLPLSGTPLPCPLKRPINKKARVVRAFEVVPEPGVEPGQPCGRGILSPLRLPVPPLRLLLV
jgi:hypothetical protein